MSQKALPEHRGRMSQIKMSFVIWSDATKKSAAGTRKRAAPRSAAQDQGTKRTMQ